MNIKKKSNEKFLEFNGKSVSFLSVDGEWWVAIKPICEALGVDYRAQHKAILNDEILSQLSSNQTMVAADGRLREMACLPEKFIYGWLFSIQSNSRELLNYKRECYEVLFDHFHGSIIGKKKTEKIKLTVEIEQLSRKVNEKIVEDPDYIKMKELEAERIRIGKEIAKHEREAESEQLDLFRQSVEN